MNKRTLTNVSAMLQNRPLLCHHVTPNETRHHLIIVFSMFQPIFMVQYNIFIIFCSSPSLFFIPCKAAQIDIWTYDISNLLLHECRGLFLWYATVKEMSWPTLPSGEEIKQEWNCTSMPPSPLKVSTRRTIFNSFDFCWTGREGRLPLLKWKHQQDCWIQSHW
jgi:hypothetical protein